MTSLLDKVEEPSFDASKNYLEELVGEGKKFSSPEDLAKGKAESDHYINLLTKRLDELRDDYSKLREDNVAKAKLQDLITQLEEKRQQLPSSDITPVKVEDKPFDPSALDSLLDKKLSERELQRRQSDNFNMVREKLQEQYGEKFPEVLNKQVKELGLTNIDDLARNSPKVLIKALGLDEKQKLDTFQTPPATRQSAFAPMGTKDRTWSYYQDLKKKNPNYYFSPEITRQMTEDYSRLGAKFEDGDWNKEFKVARF
jgi:hypothetical protein